MTRRDEVAIVGYACRLPGAKDSDGLWALLRRNICSVSEITPDRFSTQSFYHPAPDQIGRSYSFAAGVIDDVWGFDATAFGMSPREAEQVDPQHRHLLEVTNDALAHAGIRPSLLAGSPVGVYIGASSVDHAARFFADPSAAGMHMMTGNSLSIMANRISYTFDLRGPSLAVDTACSSSLVALNLAAEAIRSGAIETAIVGGVNLLLSPFSYIGFSRASMLSPTGLCRPFDASADGYVRSEGAIVVVLSSMSSALKSRSRIHAVIVGSGINQDGRTTGMSLPSPESQRQLLEQVYGDFRVDPADLSFVEAHGTGTRVGDPIEADALGKGLAQKRTRPLPIGSVKSNVGHLEPVSGLAGLLKSIMILDHGLVPATLHQRAPNPDIPFDELNLEIVSQNRRLADHRGPQLVGVNSFGFGGTNSHVILRSERAVAHLVQVNTAASPPPLLLSAHNGEALKALAGRYVETWPATTRDAATVISASAYLRDALPYRLVAHGETTDEIRHHLDSFAKGEQSAAVISGQALGTDQPLAFLFSGNGSQWAGMGREAWESNPAFRDALTEVDGRFAKVQDWSIVDTLFADDLAPRLRRATYSQPLLLALQVATVRALEERGIVASATLGHSVGEIAAAWCAGALSLDQAIDVVVARSRNQEGVRGTGGMAALMLSDREARRFLKTAGAHSVEIAAINSWRSVTVSGAIADIDRVLQVAADMRISARRLDLDYPFHSALINPVRAPLLRELQGLRPLPPHKKFVSSVTGGAVAPETLGAEHWWRNVREPVQFEPALNELLNDGLRVFLEVGPRPILASYVRDVLREAGTRGIVIDTLTESDWQSTFDPVERAASKVALAGGRIEMQRFFGPAPAAAVVLPLYPWQHTHYKVPTTDEASTALLPHAHPLLGARPRKDSVEWFSTVDPELYPWIADHKVGDVPVLPATGYVETMLSAARETYPDGALELRDLDILRPLVFEGKTSFEISVRLAHETGVVELVSRQRGGGAGADWTLNARGIIGRSPIAGKATVPPATPAHAVIVPKSSVYAWASDLGFAYGPTFQRIRQVVFPEPKFAIGTLDRPDALVHGTRIIDITALDAAFHALFASEEAGVADMPMKRMLPVRFGCVRVFQSGIVATRVTARTLRQSLSSMVVDIDLWDEHGKIVVTAQNVRLVEAPAELASDPRSLSYRTAAWPLERAGVSSTLAHRHADVEQPAGSAAALSEALLLLEAGTLRSTWSALQSQPAIEPQDERIDAADADDDASWSTFLRSALLWHLEAKNLAVDQAGARRLSPSCDLPEIDSIVSTLLVRHPTMGAEAASVSRLESIIGRLSDGDPTAVSELGSPHWRNLGLASNQIGWLRDAVVHDVAASLTPQAGRRLLRLLMVGADHFATAVDLSARFANVEITLTDLDDDRVEQARAAIGDSAPLVRCLTWSQLETLRPASLDLALAVDALSEVAAGSDDGITVITRLLRPGAPLIAGELAPSAFWDIVRGSRRRWWARSANAEFPVGALLTDQEWIDELETADFSDISVSPACGEARIGVLVHAIFGSSNDRNATAAIEPAVFSWQGTAAQDLRALVGHASTETARQDKIATTDYVLSISPDEGSVDPVLALTEHLNTIADQCRRLADTPTRLWVVVDFGNADDLVPLEQPLWCALMAALRVARNEYPGLQIRCVGLAGGPRSRVIKRVAVEMLAPDEEREVFVLGDDRIVFRVERGAATPRPPKPLANDMALRLVTRQGSGRGALGWVPEPRRAPEAGEVEIEVATTGLNFRDVMWNLRLLPEEALEDGFAGPGLGMECAGTVVRTGPDVHGLSIGDRVLAFAPSAFATHLIAKTFAVSKLPTQLSFEDGTTLPVAFLTAYYSLVHLARMEPGESVLIHGGAGAVGLAAMQIAKHRGATVIATAGSGEKRALLRSLGADFVCNSRTLAFAEEVMGFTGGKGVDVVLNSLAGEAMIRSMDCLKPFGRFIELGKRDFYANTHLGLRPLRRNLSYFGVDVDQLIGAHKGLSQQLFAEVVGFFAEGEFSALPHRVFDGAHIGEAFRLMQRAGHIGKIVVTPARQASVSEVPANTFPVDPDGWHIVIGGTSGFGFATAEWLVDRGARHIALISRSGHLSDTVAGQVEALREKGVVVEVAATDVTDNAALERFVDQLGHRRPIKGIAHAAMVLDDRLMQGIDHESIDIVLRPKASGALHLESIAGRLDLDYLLLFSSATTLFGNPGQFNYVAGNAYVEGIARRLRAKGLPALAVAWGAIEDAGYLARHIEANSSLKRRFASTLMPARTALNALDWAFDADGRQLVDACAIARIDWTMARRELVAVRAPTFNPIDTGSVSRQPGQAAVTLERLRAMPPEEATAALLDIVVEEIARVLRLPPKEVDRHRPLAEIGMDSLMMLELRTTVEASLQIELPMMSLASGITPADVARRVTPLVTGEAPREAVPSALATLSSSHLAEQAATADASEQRAAITAVMQRVKQIDGPL
ncbi:SDR family NAD(P)-dependent oxidoreductase [Reyranella sp.]|uniref:type I polyketide synthase n=1 Tax=Reyranella sp. TaxID=1929291 RepID=UPI003D14C5E7